MLKKLNSRFTKSRQLILMFIPSLVYFLVFRYGPIGGIIIAFMDYRPMYGMGFVQSMANSEWVGFDNFIRFFTSLSGLRVLKNTVIISILKILFSFPAPIILALLLNEVRSVTLKRTIQSISYLPHFISWVVIAGIFRILFSPDFGVVVKVFQSLNIDVINFMGDPRFFRSFLILSDIWQTIGWGSIIYIASISGIDKQLYEASIIDGAGKWKQLLHITLPGIASTIAVMFILRMGKIMVAGFDQVFNLYSPPVYKVADIIETYIYRVGLGQLQFSYTTAMGFFQGVIGIVMVILANLILKAAGQEGIW